MSNKMIKIKSSCDKASCCLSYVVLCSWKYIWYRIYKSYISLDLCVGPWMDSACVETMPEIVTCGWNEKTERQAQKIMKKKAETLFTADSQIWSLQHKVFQNRTKGEREGRRRWAVGRYDNNKLQGCLNDGSSVQSVTGISSWIILGL